MDERDFEGTLVLEKLAGIGKLDEFFDAVDSDSFEAAAGVLRAADIDADTIAIVLKKMADADGEH
jgi:hypothetical protein